MWTPPLLLLASLLLRSATSLPVEFGSWSDEALQQQAPPTHPEAPPTHDKAPPTESAATPGVMVSIEDQKSKRSVSFAIFLTGPEQEGSGTAGQRSGSSSQSEGVSSEEASRVAAAGGEEEDWSSEEMQSDQPSPVASEEEGGHKATLRGGVERPFNGGGPTSAGAVPDLRDSSSRAGRVIRSGSALQEAFHSIQKVVDLFSGTQGLMAALGGHYQDPTGPDSDSDEVPESTGSRSQPRTGSDDPGPTANRGGPNAEPESQEVSHTANEVGGSQVEPGLGPASPDQGVAPTVRPNNNESQEVTGFDTAFNVGSSEESPGSAPGSGPEVPPGPSSSQPPVFSDAVPSETQVNSDSSSSEAYPAPGPGSPGLGLGVNSSSAELLLHVSPTSVSDSHLAPGLNSSSTLSEEESEETPVRGGPSHANVEASEEAQQTEADSVGAAGQDGDVNGHATANYASVEADPTSATTGAPGEHANTAVGTDPTVQAVSAEDIDSVSSEATAKVNTKGAGTAEHGPNPEDTASVDAKANAERGRAGGVHANPYANNPHPNSHANSRENAVSPFTTPRRKPYRFGSLGPISHAHGAVEGGSQAKAGEASALRPQGAPRHHRPGPGFYLNPILDFFSGWSTPNGQGSDGRGSMRRASVRRASSSEETK